MSALRTPQEYLDGLRDDREVYYRGERVADVVDHPELGIAARHAALDYAFWAGADRELRESDNEGELAWLAGELRRGPIDLLLHG